MAELEIVVGDKNYSSWSMRPWLVLKRTGAPFKETVVRLNRPETAAEIAKHSPSGLVPVLKDGSLTVWDSLAISVHLQETFPTVTIMPRDPVTRTLARAATCEMHSGFAALRQECPMNLALRTTQAPSAPVQANLKRLVTLWLEMRGRFGAGGPYLFGEWCIADAFYTPVATRIRTYGLDLSDFGDDGTCAAYVETLLKEPAFLEWEKAALAEVAAS